MSKVIERMKTFSFTLVPADAEKASSISVDFLRQEGLNWQIRNIGSKSKKGPFRAIVLFDCNENGRTFLEACLKGIKKSKEILGIEIFALDEGCLVNVNEIAKRCSRAGKQMCRQGVTYLMSTDPSFPQPVMSQSAEVAFVKVFSWLQVVEWIEKKIKDNKTFRKRWSGFDLRVKERAKAVEDIALWLEIERRRASGSPFSAQKFRDLYNCIEV